MQKEWSHLWCRVWNMGPRLEEFSAPGDYVLHGMGNESFIFVLGSDEKFAAFTTCASIAATV
jgi:hypothetical protein